MIRRTVLTAALFAASWSLLGTAPGQAEEACPSVTVPPVSLPHSRAALARNGELLIVALGSSTTQSWMSSDAAHSYPAVLQASLASALTKAHVTVINRGIGGQDAAEEVPRIDTDAVAARPALVIWQVGANGVLRQTDPKLFKQLVTAGIKRLQAANIDVVLMDNQRSPMILAAPEHIKIDQSLADVALATGASLFARGALMDAWRDAGYPYDRFTSGDKLHHNDLGYRCIAEALAGSIVAGLSDPAIGKGQPPSSGALARRN